MVRKAKNSLDHKKAKGKQTISEPTDSSLSEMRKRSKVTRQETVDKELCSKGCKPSVTPGERVKETNFQSCSVPSGEKSDDGTFESAQKTEPLQNVQSAAGDEILSEAAKARTDGLLFGDNPSLILNMPVSMSLKTVANHIHSLATVAGERLKLLALDIFDAANGWFERQKPWLSFCKAHICCGCDYVIVQIKHIYPFIWTWIMHIGQLILLLTMVWLDCSIRGLSSLLHLGTTSFITVVWCSIFSIVSMVGFTKVLIFLVISSVLGIFVGFGLGILILVMFAAISLWLYGSFWTTSFIIFIGGSAFASRHERVALLITTVYASYCAKSYVGWLGLLVELNLSFISADVLTYFVKNNLNEQGSYYSREQDRQAPNGADHFYSETSHPLPADDSSASRSSGVPSTSSCDSELTSEGEVLRLLNCSDHYSALGFTRFENIDISILKREYRKKAMLVHPDKNMGNEKAAEAFKKLQNAYEILLDTLKRKTYDDELRREELLNYFRRFQSASQKNGKCNMFSSGSTHFEADDEGSHGESRKIACKKCGNFHKWICTKRSKSRARWCQDCNDFHQAKDGDGWLEQSLQPILFGLLHKVDAPCAYICADGQIYDATEWFICQGMRCPANTHKPSFHVNTTLSSKQSNNAKGTSSARGGGPMPTNASIDETMTEEEFFEWLQNAMQSGSFESSGGPSNESASAKSSGSPKGSSSVKKKRKGKKQW